MANGATMEVAIDYIYYSVEFGLPLALISLLFLEQNAALVRRRVTPLHTERVRLSLIH